MGRQPSTVRAGVCGAVLLIMLASCATPGTGTTPAPTVAAHATSEPVATAAAKPTPDIARIRSQLHQDTALQSVAEQCAAAIGAPVAMARIPIETPTGDACVACTMPLLGHPDWGVSIGEVEQPLADGTWVWLAIENLLCLYEFDSGEYKPSSVTQW